ncbi:MAG TPA: hypothetical protein VNK43_05230 [Gemmatimonadales bacterium]|nr:hypothetical protein [Gemmatimonadales bacterium]
MDPVVAELGALATAAALGFLHALEVDHMIAVTTFVSRRPALAAAARFGARWGIGHSVAVLVAGGVLLATGLRWPERFDALGEALVGVVILGLGLWAIRSARNLHLHRPEEHGGHAHLHLHGGKVAGPGHEHPHDAAHPADRPHRHGHGVTLVGLLHGLAGTSGVVALVPVTMIERTWLGVGYLVAFGVGVTLAMTLYALVAALAMRQAAGRSLEWGRRIARGIGVAGVAIGAWWVWRAMG